MVDIISISGNGRFNGTFPDGSKYGYSAPLSLTEEEHQEIINSIIKIDNQRKAFNKLSENDRLKFEVRRLTYEMSEVMELCKIKFDSPFPETEMEKRLDKLRGDIFCELESTLMETPDEWAWNRHKENGPINWQDMVNV